MKSVIVITGASSGFGALAARALAKAGRTVYASMRETASRNAPQVEAAKQFSIDNSVDLRTIELDVASQQSADEAIRTIVQDNGSLDVVIHNAGHMVFGAAEAFTPEQLAQVYDANVLSTQRVNRAALPQLRKQRNGLVLWIGSTSTRGGTPPYLAPYFAAKAAMDALAVSYAAELNRWGIETSILVPGAFTSGTNHFAHAGVPADKARKAEYERTLCSPRRGHHERLCGNCAGRRRCSRRCPGHREGRRYALRKASVSGSCRSRTGWLRNCRWCRRSRACRDVPQHRPCGSARPGCPRCLIHNTADFRA